jgi:cyclase
MLRIRIVPCLLLRGGGLVKTVRFDSLKYVGDPINAVRIFNEKEVDELVFLDIGATAGGHGPNFEVVRDIASEAFMPLGYGGGITNVDEIRRLFTIGVEKIILNTAAHTDPRLIEDAARIAGSQSIVVSIDVKRGLLGKYSVFSHSGTVNQRLGPVESARRAVDAGAGEILLTSIDRDGTQQGYDLELVEMVAASVPVPVIACGGAGSLADFRDAVRRGASAVAAGSLFVFHGKHRAVLITYPDYSALNELLQRQ